MNLRKGTAALGLLGLLVATPGCKDFYDINVDPLNPTSARLQEILPASQGSMSVYLGLSALGLSQATSTLVNQLASTRDVGSYTPDGSSFSNQWAGLYSDCLINNEQVIKQGTASQSWDYVGIAQIQKAFVVSQMVDMWGDIPYSEALQGSANRAPKYDKDSDIYKDLLSLIDAGLANLDKKTTSAGLGTADLIYKGNLTKWARMGRTLKLKLLNQIRLNPAPVLGSESLSAKVTDVLKQDLMTSNEDDYEFKYNASTTPENRNLGYIADYVTASRENLIGRFFYVDMMLANADNGNAADPRLPYYFYNQVSTTATQPLADFQLGRFITVLVGSFGPNRNQNNSDIRTLPGLYAVGGKYDNGTGGAANVNSGKGVVAQRFLTYPSRRFTEAEAQLTILNSAAAARTALESGILAAFDKVNLIASADGSPLIPAASITNYATAVLARYDAETTSAGKLRIIMQEKYKAGWGFGEDVYTDYRRTGYPAITLPGSEPHTQLTGGYPLRLPYRQDDLTSNPNAPKQVNVYTDRIFWDIN
ncbi:SusD/RagB family nutrient-binding outer membrane lipoprotein [Hymenobacter chitinivorans]|uniref:SusD-like starch-binding protein associating with outer membrane n=1 Tax=Hymenobacter chitinivorans DSM 11115 TaxID=1121954 RepID=A0A2M9AQK6_9BACT|nr:SusD/RagB family nutrient-binding outer membrane lipoprotein [Hymenobacter chitinivorans]PJJ47923.1 SusD-like starch-binding protein associating with outer membrane [Hymenobacter chitinivorans DSM 11115]